MIVKGLSGLVGTTQTPGIISPQSLSTGCGSVLAMANDGEKMEPSAGPSWVGGRQEEEEKVEEDRVLIDEEVEEEEEEDEDEDDDNGGGDGEGEGGGGFFPGPLVPLKAQLENDKDDESLRKWKQQLLGSLEGDLTDQVEPEVTFHSIGIMSDDCGEITTPLPISNNQCGVLFTLNEGSKYRIKLTFTVQHNIVSGLRYSNTASKRGMKDRSKGMFGTFAPQREPYTFTMNEETTPSGIFARGVYSAMLKIVDDDNRCHLDLNYLFEIKKRS